MSGTDQSPVGLVGRIVVASRGAAGPGEVKVLIRGGTEHYIARSREPIEVGATVIVLAETGPRSVEVSPWDDPLGSAPATP